MGIKEILRYLRQRRIAYVFLIPFFAMGAIIIYYPLIQSVWMGFTDASLRKTQETFVGLENYRRLFFEDTIFWITFKNTIIWTISTVGIAFVCGLGMALLLNMKLRGIGIFRGLAVAPWVLPSSVVGLVWNLMFWKDNGILNNTLRTLGLIQENIGWLVSPALAMLAIVVAFAWWRIPFVTIMLLAGLESIPVQLYEAARIDGAGALQRFRHLTIPLLSPVSAVVILISAIWSFGHFDIPWIMTRGGPVHATQLLSTYTYSTFMYLETGYAAAIGDTMLLILTILGTFYLRRGAQE